MYVCVCNKVTDGQIREACENGASSMDCLRDRLKVATCCGRCHDCAEQLLRDAQATRWQGEFAAAMA